MKSLIVIISILINDDKVLGFKILDLLTGIIKVIEFDDTIRKALNGSDSLYGLRTFIGESRCIEQGDDTVYSLDYLNLSKVDYGKTIDNIKNYLKKYYFVKNEEVAISEENGKIDVKFLDSEPYELVAKYKGGYILYCYLTDKLLYRNEDDILDIIHNFKDTFCISGLYKSRNSSELRVNKNEKFIPDLDNIEVSNSIKKLLDKLIEERGRWREIENLNSILGSHNGFTMTDADVVAFSGEYNCSINLPRSATGIVNGMSKYSTYGIGSVELIFNKNIKSIGDNVFKLASSLNIKRANEFNVRHIGKEVLNSASFEFDSDIDCSDGIDIDERAFTSVHFKSSFGMRLNVNELKTCSFNNATINIRELILGADKNNTGIIDTRAFRRSSIDRLVLKDGLTLGKDAFVNCRIEELVIDGTVRVSDGYGFRGCSIPKLEITDNCKILYGNLLDKFTNDIDNDININDGIKLRVEGYGTPEKILNKLIYLDGVTLGTESCSRIEIGTGYDDINIEATVDGDRVFYNSVIRCNSIALGNIINGNGCFEKASMNVSRLTVSNLYTEMFAECTANRISTLRVSHKIDNIPYRAFYKVTFNNCEESIIKMIGNFEMSSDTCCIEAEAFAGAKDSNCFSYVPDTELSFYKIREGAFKNAEIDYGFGDLVIHSDFLLKDAFMDTFIISYGTYGVTAVVETKHVERGSLQFSNCAVQVTLGEDTDFFDGKCTRNDGNTECEVVYTKVSNDDIKKIVEKFNRNRK